ncbi:dienelactone hydrolase family protein [Streptomyces mangrovisoli]|uniref:Hydrolase n=1 Tax=Streptomyces mangrovisoli TaxID=1428628 RepID=A0A1J4P5Y2_9ACTN|nr:dienelactone hydrolase family protein [Streptomyces mangrovisoli]OIJ68942.1 hydrolase [Streptomyces mangrovisoli]
MISEMVSVPADHVTLGGDLVVPDGARAVVLCAHGISDTRHGARSRAMAAELNGAGFATLALDLLSEREDRDDVLTAAGEQRFDVYRLGRRTVAGVDWLNIQPGVRSLPLVLLGAGSEAAAVLEAAAELPDLVLTAVTWGGRPDLATEALRRVRVPVLLIAGDRDPQAQKLTEDAAQHLGAPHAVQVVPGATHHFDEPEVVNRAVAMTVRWCDERLDAGRESP